MTGNKHLTFDDRMAIADGIKNISPFHKPAVWAVIDISLMINHINS